MHQDPQVPNYRVRPRAAARGWPGLAVEPMLNLGDRRNRLLDDDWTVVTVDGRGAAHFEHSGRADRPAALGADRPRRRAGLASFAAPAVPGPPSRLSQHPLRCRNIASRPNGRLGFVISGSLECRRLTGTLALRE